MSSLTPESPEIKDLQVEQIVTYLLHTGWRAVPHPHPNLQLFEGNTDDFGQPIQLILPSSTDSWDSSIIIAKAINLLAAVEDCPPAEILENIGRKTSVEA